MKIIARGSYWICANMDLLADIIEEGTEYLLDDGTRIRVPDGKENELVNSLEYATEEEKKQYAREHYNYIFRGDKVIIARGRKLKGEEKVVNGYYRFEVAGTYGKVYTDYIYFTDGTKTNLQNLDVVGVDYKDNYRIYQKTFSNYMFNVGGRI